MKNPLHPGLSVRADWLEPLGLTVTRQQFLPKWRSASTRRLAAARKTWLRLQASYDLARAEKHADKIKVKRVA